MILQNSSASELHSQQRFCTPWKHRFFLSPEFCCDIRYPPSSCNFTVGTCPFLSSTTSAPRPCVESQARPELNGLEGVLTFREEEKGRWKARGAMKHRWTMVALWVVGLKWYARDPSKKNGLADIRKQQRGRGSCDFWQGDQTVSIYGLLADRWNWRMVVVQNSSRSRGSVDSCAGFSWPCCIIRGMVRWSFFVILVNP